MNILSVNSINLLNQPFSAISAKRVFIGPAPMVLFFLSVLLLKDGGPEKFPVTCADDFWFDQKIILDFHKKQVHR
jgi:hypothetical protein